MYKPTIGLEIHSELKTKSKMFCTCSNKEEKEANRNICPTCTAQPGSLPVINREAVDMVIKTGLALNCKINKENHFERKNYFYPDLPKGYQVSQFELPLCYEGKLKISDKEIGITRIHLEEDTGRLQHPEGTDYSLIDLNRAGVPLMELVTEPDIENGEQAREFAQKLQLILRYLGVSDADMEKGQMRVEVNISVSKTDKLGTKVEIKNLNSIRAAYKSIDYEIKRQTELIESGGEVLQETRGWNDQKEETFAQRMKEDSHDYRYFPDPDLPGLVLTDEEIRKIEGKIPELPDHKRNRFKKEYNVPDQDIDLYVTQKDLGEYFEKVASELANWLQHKDLEDQEKKAIKLASNYITSDLQAMLKGKEFIEDEFKIDPENFAEFISMIYKGEISSKIAKFVLQKMFKTGKDPSNIIDEEGLKLMEDDGEIEKIAKEIIENNRKAVLDYKSGKESSIQYLLGQLMAKTRGRAEPGKALEILKKLL